MGGGRDTAEGEARETPSVKSRGHTTAGWKMEGAMFPGVQVGMEPRKTPG